MISVDVSVWEEKMRSGEFDCCGGEISVKFESDQSALPE